MDFAISITIMLFILSMINERISNFIKLQYSDKKVWFGKMNNLSTKMVGPDEDDRTKRILAVNVITGTCVSIFLRANLIDILSHLDRPYEAIGWNRPLIYWDILTIPIGCFLTGCFISLGSKFWHDLLDLLLATKNLKEKLVDQRTYQNVVSADQVQEFVLTPESKIAQTAVEQYSERLMAIQGVLTVGRGYLNSNGGKVGCIEVHVSDLTVTSQISKSYPVKASPTLNVEVPTKVVVTGSRPKAQTISAGEGVSNSSKQLGNGTLGAFVKDNVTTDRYLLSCFHVLNGDNNWKKLSDSKTILETTNNVDKEIADLHSGFRTNELDVAIATLRADIDITNKTINSPKKFREVKGADAISETKIHFLGFKSQTKREGFIYGDSWPATFEYPDGSTWKLNDLIILTKIDISTNTYKPISQGGDSGAIIIDENNVAVAMLVGSDESFSYGMKISKIMGSLDISFI